MMILYWIVFSVLAIVLISILIRRRGRRILSNGTITFLKGCLRLLKWSAKWGSITLAGLAVLLLIFYAEEDWRGKGAWENCKRQLEAQGEKLDWKDFIPPPVPDDQNFALTPIVASSYEQYLDKNGHLISPPNTNVVDRLTMDDVLSMTWTSGPPLPFGDWQSGRKINLTAWQTFFRKSQVTTGTHITNAFPITPMPQSPAADILLALSKYDSTIEELRQASHLPYSRFPLNYDTDNPQAELRLFHLDPLGSCTRVLRLRAVAELENNQSEKALADIKLIFFLAHSIQDPKLSFISVVRGGMLNTALQPVWEGIAGNQWSADQLASIQQGLSGVDLLSDYDAGLRGERVMALCFIEHERQTHDADHVFDFDDEEEFDFQEHAAWLYHRLFPQGWYYQNEAILASAYQESFRNADELHDRILSPEIVRRSRFAAGYIEAHYDSPYCFYDSRLFAGLFDRTTMLVAYHQTTIDLACIACALERYHLKHGEYPKTLDTLVPEFMEKVPTDVINGQPLHYRRTNDGKFLLYSVGWNEKDDGGKIGVYPNNPAIIDLEKGDWVWPAMAK